MRTFVTVIAVAVLVYLAACAALFYFQRSLIYFPQTAARPGDNVTLEVDGTTLLVATRPHSGPDAVIYFGGNAEDVSATLPELMSAFPAQALFLMHYRGYGGSSGVPSERALHQDALALFDRVHAQHPHVVVVGRSLGSGIAIRLATLRPVVRLVLVTPYDSLQDLAASLYPMFPVRWLLADKFESKRYARLVQVPTTIVAAERDEVIPRASTDQLHARFATGVARMHVLPGVGHNTISANPLYAAILRGEN
jgi:pimeloyl-ACP methyl ester carboxylesterase